MTYTGYLVDVTTPAATKASQASLDEGVVVEGDSRGGNWGVTDLNVTRFCLSFKRGRSAAWGVTAGATDRRGFVIMKHSKSDSCLVPVSVPLNLSLGCGFSSGGCNTGWTGNSGGCNSTSTHNSEGCNSGLVLKQAQQRSQLQRVQRAPTLPTAISCLHLSQS